MLKLKACLHLHIQGDPHENIKYSHRELFTKAKEKGIEVMAVTCHHKVIFSDELKNMAAEYGILLIPGVEAEVEKKHILILNADITANDIKSFKDLKFYRQQHPESLIIAPHPFHGLPNCLGRKLIKHIDLFDGIEWNYYYSKLYNPNLKAEKVAQKYNKPLISTSDVHMLKYIDKCYTIINVEEKSTKAVIDSIRKNKLELVNSSFSTLELFTVIIRLFLATR